jgi:hypothetical protein
LAIGTIAAMFITPFDVVGVSYNRVPDPIKRPSIATGQSFGARVSCNENDAFHDNMQPQLSATRFALSNK